MVQFGMYAKTVGGSLSMCDCALLAAMIKMRGLRMWMYSELDLWMVTYDRPRQCGYVHQLMSSCACGGLSGKDCDVPELA